MVKKIKKPARQVAAKKKGVTTLLFPMKERPNLSHEQMNNIVWLRFGCLDDLEKKVTPCYEIAKRLRLPVKTVYNFLWYFKRQLGRGKNLLDYKLHASFHSGRGPMTDSMEHDQELLNPLQLKKWSHLTLKERSVKINRRYNCYTYASKLSVFYRRHGVNHRTNYTSYRGEFEHREAIANERREFAPRLAQHLKDGGEVWYVDGKSLFPVQFS